VQKICEAIGLCRLIGVNSIEQELPMNTRISIFTVAATWAIAVAAFALSSGVSNDATAQPPQRQPVPVKPQQGPTAANVLLDPKDTLVLLLDHQTGLFQTVKDIPIAELRANTVVLAKIATLAKAPILTTASEPRGPNGPLMPELATAAPEARYIARKGEVSAWDNEDFRNAVRASGKKTLIMAGVWTSVCVAFPALQAKAEGYTVYAVIDASGDMSELAQRATVERMAQAGIIPVTTNVVLTEFQRTWARPDSARWGALYRELVPHYRAVNESYQNAQTAARRQATSK
jgi:nicotinamidase-related amidase